MASIRTWHTIEFSNNRPPGTPPEPSGSLRSNFSNLPAPPHGVKPAGRPADCVWLSKGIFAPSLSVARDMTIPPLRRECQPSERPRQMGPESADSGPIALLLSALLLPYSWDSGTRYTAPSGGSVRVTDAGFPSHSRASAMTRPPFVTPEPPYSVASVLTTSRQAPLNGTPVV